MEFYTYFELKELPSHFINSEYITLFLGIGGLILSLLIFKFKDKINYDQKIIVAWALLLVGVFSTIVYFYSLTSGNKHISDPLALLNERGLLDSTEGFISDFKIENQNTRGGQRTIESFNIGQVAFQYNDYPAAKFNNFSKTQRKGGILKDSLYAKILFIKHGRENRIVKIELVK